MKGREKIKKGSRKVSIEQASKTSKQVYTRVQCNYSSVNLTYRLEITHVITVSKIKRVISRSTGDLHTNHIANCIRV